MFFGCPIRSSGNLQLESVLSPLLMLQQSTGGSDEFDPTFFPIVRILDFGCGNGRLLDALRTFSTTVLRSIQYVGLDISAEAIEAAKRVASRPDIDAPNNNSLEVRLRECIVGNVSEYADRMPYSKFEIVHIVDVIHHLNPIDELPKFLHKIINLLSLGGYVIIEDVFLGNYPVNLAMETYLCDRACYLGPAELGCIFSPHASSGFYRYFRKRKRKEGQPTYDWFGYTYVIRKVGRLRFYPSLNSYIPGIYSAIRNMRNRAVEVGQSNAWYASYAQYLDALIQELMYKFSEERMNEILSPYYTSLDHLDLDYFEEDPFLPPDPIPYGR